MHPSRAAYRGSWRSRRKSSRTAKTENRSRRADPLTAGAGTIGLTFAALGFLWACFGGVFLINLGIRKGWLGAKFRQRLQAARVRSGICEPGEKTPAGSRQTTETEAIDTLSFNLGAVFLVYLLTFLLLKALTYLLSFAGAEGRELAVNLWGISFIFAALLALGAKQLFKALKIDHVLDSGTLTRIAGSSVDILVAAALGAISLVVVARYLLPIVVMAVFAGLLTVGYVMWFTSRLFEEHRFQRAMIIYGAATGGRCPGATRRRSGGSASSRLTIRVA